MCGSTPATIFQAEVQSVRRRVSSALMVAERLLCVSASRIWRTLKSLGDNCWEPKGAARDNCWEPREAARDTGPDVAPTSINRRDRTLVTLVRAALSVRTARGASTGVPRACCAVGGGGRGCRGKVPRARFVRRRLVFVGSMHAGLQCKRSQRPSRRLGDSQRLCCSTRWHSHRRRISVWSAWHSHHLLV